MKTQLLLQIAWTALLGLPILSLHAQLVPDGGTATLANVTTNITGTVTVGTNGAFTLLTLADNALLTNSAHGVIGRNAMARSNEVHLVSSSARWRMGGDLFVGSNGSFSRLVVSNGATVGAAVDGSIEVISATQPGFASISLSGTNLVVTGTNGTPNGTYTMLASTNVALPVASWVSITTNQFNASGQFSFTNAITPGFLQRFFRLRSP